jgi:fatty acid desaturase
MEQLKRFLGIIWMLIGPIAIAILLLGAISNIDPAKEGDINKPLPWIIIIAIFTPVAIGLTVFGWYAWKGEYRKERNIEQTNKE